MEHIYQLAKDRLVNWLGRNSTRLSTGAIILVWLLVFLHHIVPPVFQWLKLPERHPPAPDIVEALIVSLLIFVFDSQVRLTRSLGSSQLVVHDCYASGYDRLMALMQQHGAKAIDLIQFTGHDVMPVLEAAVAKGAQVRLLLYKAEFTRNLDPELGTGFHENRFQTTVGVFRLWKREKPDRNFEIRAYSSPASISSVLVDGRLVYASWYVQFPEGDAATLAVRGTTALTATADEPGANLLIEMVREQFERLWLKAERVFPESGETAKLSGRA